MDVQVLEYTSFKVVEGAVYGAEELYHDLRGQAKCFLIQYRFFLKFSRSAELTLTSTIPLTATHVPSLHFSLSLPDIPSSFHIYKSHSEVPEADEDWPTLQDILAYRDRIRDHLMQVYDDIDSGKRKLNRSLARVLQMTLEHEEFHTEVSLFSSCISNCVF